MAVKRRHIGPRERAVIFGAAGGCCWICGQKIDGVRERWEVEHVVALALGGDEAAGSDNLQPAHVKCHAVKTAEDAGRIAKAKRIEAKHAGIRAPKSTLPGSRSSAWKRRLDGTVVRRDPP